MKIEDEIKSSFRNDYQKLIVNLYLTHSRLDENFSAIMKQHDITSTQFNVLRILKGQKQKPASIGLIKDRMIERNSDVSRIIDRLLKKKLIKRSENKLDRRQRDIVISKEGIALITKIAQHDDLIDNQLSHISLEEAKIMNDLLDKLRAVPTK